MTNEEAISYFKRSYTSGDTDDERQHNEAIDIAIKAIKALGQQPCEDCVSRQEVLDTVGNVPDYDDGMVWEALSHAQRDVALLPSVTPSYNSIKTELKPCEDVLDEIIAQIEQTRDKDKIAEYPYNRCIRIIEGYKTESEE